MATSIRDLFVAVTTKVDSGGLTDLDKKLDGAKDKIGKVAAFLAGGFIAKGVSDFVRGQLDAADSLNDTAAVLGVATDDLERFGFVAQMSGSSAEVMQASLGKLNKAIGANAKGFAALGVDLKNADGSARETGDVFLDVVENFGALESQGEKTAVAMELFGKSGAELIPMLSQGSENLTELIERFEELGGATPEEFLKQAGEINDTIDEIGYTSTRMKQQLVGAFAPAIAEILKGVVNVTGKIVNFEKRTKALSAAAKVAAASFLLLKFVTMAGQIAKAAKAAATLKNALGFSKNVLLGGGLFLAVLLIQDLITFAKGGESVIGKFMTELVGPEEAKKFAADLLTTWNQVAKVLSDSLPGIMTGLSNGLPAAIEGFIKFADVISRTIILLTNFFGMITELPGQIGSAIDRLKQKGNTRLVSQEEVDAQKRIDQRMMNLANVYDGNNFGGIAGTKAVQFVPNVTPSVQAAANPQPGASAAAMGWNVVPGKQVPVNQTVSQTNNNTFNISGTGAAETADKIKGVMPDTSKKMLRDAKGALERKAP